MAVPTLATRPVGAAAVLRRVGFGHPPRAVWLAAVALSLFALTCAYRFASMGGTLGGFEDDEFVNLAYAQQIVMGDAPVADFAENGSPLTHALSALAITWIGPPLLAEAALTMSMLGICAAVLFLLAERASRSIPIAMTVALLGIAMAPRYYNYPKLLAYAIALPAIWWYIDRPGRLQLFLVAAAGVTAFLLRHDHGAYVAAAALAAIAVARWPDIRGAAGDALLAGAMALALVSPYLAYVQVHFGVAQYTRAFVDFSRRSATQTNAKPLGFTVDTRQRLFALRPVPGRLPEINVAWRANVSAAQRENAERELGLAVSQLLHGDTWKYQLGDSSRARLRAIVTHPLVADTHGIDRAAFVLNDPLFTAPQSWTTRAIGAIASVRIAPGLINQENAVPFLYYLIVAIPLAALAFLFARAAFIRDAGWPNAPAKIAVTAILALLMIAGLLRGNPTSRFADVIEVVGVLAAWVAAMTVRQRSHRVRVAAIVLMVTVVVLASASIQAIENVSGQIGQTRITSSVSAARTETRNVYRQLSGVPPIQRWSTETPGIIALARYVHDCTRPDDRVLAMAYVPQLLVMAGRGFAGGLPWFLPKYFDDRRTEDAMVPRLHDHRVPIAVVVTEPDYSEDYVPSFPSLAAALESEYRDLGAIDFGLGARYNLLVKRDLQPVRRYGSRALPCFAR